MTSTTKIPNVIVSPCGTSLLTNQVSSELRTLLLETANQQKADLTPDQQEKIAEHIQQRRNTLLDSSLHLETIQKMSAELNGIITYHNGDLSPSVPEHHFLLVSDTYQGEQVGEMVAAWLRNKGLIASIIKIPDLATSEAETFRNAMSELIKWCDDTLTSYRQQGYHIIFSLTGGFKGVNGFLQAIAMFYADESVYIFQASSQLLRIPKLPINIDKEGIVGEHLTLFRKLEVNFSVTRQEATGIPETLLFPIDDKVILSEWGELVWRQAKPTYYQQRLLYPLSSRLEYSNRFQSDVAAIGSERLEILNYRLDQLSRYLESNGDYNPLSLDFKKLKGKPHPQATHECDAWSDKDAKRLYGHFEATGTFIVDSLSSHL